MAVLKQAWAKQGVEENGHRDSGRGRACGSGAERTPGGAADTSQAQERTWSRVGARNAQASAFKDEKLQL